MVPPKMDTVHEQRPVHEKQLFWLARGNPSEYEGRHSNWDDGKAQDSANNTEGVAMEGKEKTQGREKGTEEDGVAVWDTKENASEQERVKGFVVTAKTLWELHRLLNNRKGSLSSTYKKNTEANNKVYDLNQRTVVVKESAAADMLFASEEGAVDKLEAARQHQDRTLEVPQDCRKSMHSAFRECSNCRALHEAAWFDVKEASRRHSELKRKAGRSTRENLSATRRHSSCHK